MGSALVLALFVVALEIFQFGIVIPIVPSILGIFGSLLVANNYIQLKKERENFSTLKVFTLNLNHKLRSTLNSVRGSANLVEKELENFKSLNSPRRKKELERKIDEINLFTHKILDKADLGVAYIEEISTYMERTELSRRSLYLTKANETIEEVIKKTCSLNLKRKAIRYSLRENYDSTLEEELINYSCIEAVISALLNNAFTAIEMRNNRLQKNYLPTISINTKNERNCIKIEIEDNGVGIPATQQKEIFKARTSYTLGQGIGLNIVESFLSIEKGKISFTSQEGKGTKFTVLIPKRNNRNKTRSF